MSIDAELLSEVLHIYGGRGEAGAAATKALFATLTPIGAAGEIAINLYRACKSSERAKAYRGRNYRGAAYDKKQWAMGNLCGALEVHAAALGLTWGWGDDDAQPVHNRVLYIDLPTGQVSFHSDVRGAGPDYAGAWDGVRSASSTRICLWIARLLSPLERKAAA